MLKTNRKTFLQSLLAYCGITALSPSHLFSSAYAQNLDLQNLDLPKQPHATDDLSWAAVAKYFPVTHNPKLRYFNIGSIGVCPYSVTEEITQTMKRLNGDLHHLQQQNMPDDGHRQCKSYKHVLANFMGCTDDELVLTRNTTEGVNIICNGLPPLKQGYTLITSNKEHIGNVAAWVNRAQGYMSRQHHKDLKIITVEPNSESHVQTVKHLMSTISQASDTQVIVSVPHVASDGYRFPVKALGQAIAKHNQDNKQNVFYFIDGAQALGMLEVKVKDYLCHAYAASGHKWLSGPKGTGVLYVSKNAQNFIQPIFTGAYSCDASFAPQSISFSESAMKYESGTQATQLIAGLAKATDFFQTIGMQQVEARVLYLAQYFRNLIQTFNQAQSYFKIELLSAKTPEAYSSMVTFAIHDLRNHSYLNAWELAYQKLKGQTHDQASISFRLRHIYEGGLDGVRASFHIFHQKHDIDILFTAITQYLSTL